MVNQSSGSTRKNQFPSSNFVICTTHYIGMLQREEQETIKFLVWLSKTAILEFLIAVFA